MSFDATTRTATESNNDRPAAANRRLWNEVGAVHLDLGQVEAFAAAAEDRHFGRAAARLHITQQGLSHRIARLERALGEPLFVRGTTGVELTDAGRRFLPRARDLLNTARRAVDEMRAVRRPLRIDVWGQVHAPLRWLRRLNSPVLRFDVEISMRRSTLAAAQALARNEIDVAFGRVADPADLPESVTARPICREPIGVLLGAAHPATNVPAVRPADLAPGGLWCPAGGTAVEVADFSRRFAHDFALPLEESGLNLGLDHLVTNVDEQPARATLLPAAMSLPAGHTGRLVPLQDPTPLYTHAMLWRRDDRDETLTDLRRAFTDLAAAEGWLDYDPRRHWLPTPDRP
jgi:DNA-binding transcriptional LysR family regulator